MTDPRAPDMRLFARKLLLFILVQGVIWTGVVALYIRYATINAEGFGKGYLAAAIDKHNRLAQQPSPRIVFVGGSNLAFGLDSAETERSLRSAWDWI